MAEAGVSAIIVAGGQGTRLGAGVPKALVPIAGRSLLERSAARLAAVPSVDEVVLVVPADEQGNVAVIAASRTVEKAGRRAVVVAGGARRQDSVRCGIAGASAGEGRLVAVHDAARPFVAADDVERAVAVAREVGGAVLAEPARDTVKWVAEGEGERIERTMERARVWLAQTPQVFAREVLDAALANADADRAEVTDCSSAVERAGGAVAIVAASGPNPKVTTPADLPMAAAIAAEQDGGVATMSTRAVRVGFGSDLHPLVPGRPFILGTIRLEHPTGPKGHSDGDALSHAIVDAILGAAALGDIGDMFPDTDASIEGISGTEILKGAVERVRAAGLEVGNIDATVNLERPKLGPRKAEMRERIAAALGVDQDRVNVKAKRGEGLDAVGRGEAVAAHVVATLIPHPQAAGDAR